MKGFCVDLACGLFEDLDIRVFIESEIIIARVCKAV